MEKERNQIRSDRILFFFLLLFSPCLFAYILSICRPSCCSSPLVLSCLSYEIVVKGPMRRVVETLIHNYVFIDISSPETPHRCACVTLQWASDSYRGSGFSSTMLHYTCFNSSPYLFGFFAFSATIGEVEMRCIQLVATWNITDGRDTGPIRIHLVQAESLVFLMTPAGWICHLTAVT